MVNDALEMNINLFTPYRRRIYHIYSFIIYFFRIIIFVVTSLFRSNNVPSGDLVGPIQGTNQLVIKVSGHKAWVIFLFCF